MRVSFIAWSILWMIISLLLVVTIDNTSIYAHDVFVASNLASYFLCLYNWLKCGNRLSSIYVVFVVYAMFSNLGQSLLYYIPNIDVFMGLYNYANIKEVNQMLRFQLCCIAAFNLGTVLFIAKKRNSVTTKELQDQYASLLVKKWGIVEQQVFDMALIITSFLIVVFSLHQLQMRQTMSYAELYDSRDLIHYSITYSCVALGTWSILRKRHVQKIYYLWLFLIAAFFIAGTRALAIVYIGAFVVLLPISHPRLFVKKYLPYWGVLGVALFVLLGVISSFREGSIGDAEVDTEGGVLIGMYKTVNEMGASARVNVLTMNYADELQERPQTIGYALVRGFLPDPVANVIVPQNWRIHFGDWVHKHHSSTSGWGGSFIAEFYLNYGWLAPLFMLIYGFLIAFLENSAYKRIKIGSVFFLSIIIPVLSRQVFFARGQMGLITDYIRMSFIFFILWLLFGALRSGSFKNV